MMLREVCNNNVKKLEESRQTINGNNVQMALQHIHCIELKTTLANKETKPTKDRRKLFPGRKGCLLTGNEFTDDIRTNFEIARQKEADVENRKAERAQKSAQKETEKVQKEREKKEKKEAYDAAITAWKKQCENLRAQGMRVKDLPTKPRFRTKRIVPGTGRAERTGGQGSEERAEDFEAEIDELAEQSHSDE